MIIVISYLVNGKGQPYSFPENLHLCSNLSIRKLKAKMQIRKEKGVLVDKQPYSDEGDDETWMTQSQASMAC